MAPESAITIVLCVFIIKCITAGPLDPTKIDYEKVNRDGETPRYPFDPDLRLKPAQIIQAHEVLRIALRSYLDLKDANLTDYLNAMRKKNESYLDEFGNEIKGYKTIFSLILKQVDEVENTNYAVRQFECDKFDLCSISKYLSHQKTFFDRQNIMTKMGDALGTKCDPLMPYKRLIHGDPDSSVNQMPENQCRPQIYPITTEAPPSHFPGHQIRTEAAPSHFPAITISDENYLEKLCNGQSLDVRLKNTITREFLYAAADDRALDEERRRVFTWKDLNDIPGIQGNAWTGEETWRIEPVDKYFSSNSFRVKNIRNIYGPREYLFANSSDSVYVRRGLPDEDSAVLTSLGSSAKWQILARVADDLRGDYCAMELSAIQGFVLRNEKYASGYFNADQDDVSMNDPTGTRRNTRLSKEGPSYWDILPLSTYRPVPAMSRVWQDGPNGTKWGIDCDFNGNDIVGSYIQNVSDSECIDRCIANDACTHWTYSMSGDKRCNIKKSNDEMLEMYHIKSQCGFVPGRSWQKF